MTLRRSVKVEDGDLEDMQAMSLEDQRAWVMKKIQEADLGNDNANAIMTDDYNNRPPPQPVMLRQCDVAGTSEAQTAQKNKDELTAWNSFGNQEAGTENATILEQAGPSRVHGSRTAAGLREDEQRLGHPLTLEDTYTDRGGARGRGGKYGQSLLGRGVPNSLKRPPSNPISSSQAAPNKKRSKSNASPAKHVPVVKKHASKQVASPVGPAPVAKQTQAFKLAEPSEFLSVMENRLGKGDGKAGEKALEPDLQEKVSVKVVQDTLLVPTMQVTKQTVATKTNNSAMPSPQVGRALSAHAEEFIPNTVNTHTDGAPSPATLSGFSSLDEHTVQVSAQPESHDLIGLGIENIDMSEAPAMLAGHTSSSANIMDSPIPNDVHSEVMPAKINFNDFFKFLDPETATMEELLRYKDFLDKQIEVKATQAPQSESKITPVGQPLASSTTTVTSPPRRPNNPFGVREPLTGNDGNISASSILEKNANLQPIENGASTTKPAIDSKWAPEPVLQSTTCPVSGLVATSTGIKEPMVPQSNEPRHPKPFTSKDTILSKWADKPAELPTTQSVFGAAASSIRSPSPIIGDAKVYGARGHNYDPPPPPKQPTKAKQFQKPGPGFERLLRDLNNMQLNSGNN